MFTEWITAPMMSHRFDGEFYRPAYVENERKLAASAKCRRLGDLVDSKAPITNGIRGPSLADSEFRMLRLQDVDGLWIDSSQSLRVSEKQYIENRRAWCTPGDILLAIGGYIGVVGKVVDHVPQTMGQHSARIRLSKDADVDTDYLLAFFASTQGTMLCQRYVSGGVQAGINLEDVREIQIPLPDHGIQRAIGNKVRKAERLRALASQAINQSVMALEEALNWYDFYPVSENAWWTSASEVGSRLDCMFSSSEKLSTLRHLTKCNISCEKLANLLSVSAMVGWKGLTTEFYRNSGPYLIRPVNFDGRALRTTDIVCVDVDKYREQPQIHLQQGDIVMIKDGNGCGRTMVLPAMRNSACAGSTLARLRARSTVDPYFVETVLNHQVCQVQIESLITGMAQPHITQEWIAELILPRVDNEETIAHHAMQHHEFTYELKDLLASAIHDVEALFDQGSAPTHLIHDDADITRWLQANPA
jgi:type I restriction enzyme S subunit